MTTIKLHGKLAEAIGNTEWNLEIKSVAEQWYQPN